MISNYQEGETKTILCESGIIIYSLSKFYLIRKYQVVMKIIVLKIRIIVCLVCSDYFFFITVWTLRIRLSSKRRIHRHQLRQKRTKWWKPSTWWISGRASRRSYPNCNILRRLANWIPCWCQIWRRSSISGSVQHISWWLCSKL